MKTELVVLKKLEVVPFFTKGESLDETLDEIARQARAHVPDVSTAKGRAAITKNITDIVTASKTYLENSGKELSAEYKALPKIIDANRKKAKDFLTDLQIELRQVLTDWNDEQKRIKAEAAEAAEKAKREAQLLADHEVALLMNEKFDRDLADQKAEEERQRIEAARVAKEEQDKRDEAIRLQAAEDAKLKAEQEAAEKIATEKAKVEAAEAAQRESERLRKLAEEKAKQDVIDAENKRVEDLRLAVEETERQRQAAIQAEERRIAQEVESKQRADKQEADRVAAEARWKEDQERLKKQHDEAQAKAVEQSRLDEVARQNAEAERQAEILATRKANQANRHAVHTDIKNALIALGIDADSAVKIVTAMKDEQLPHVKLNY